MKNFLINMLFRLLGSSNSRLYNIQYLFGASTHSHETRKAKWEHALVRLYKDKDLLDYLYYQSESDKENIFRGVQTAELSRGARIRTLFLIFSARRAYEEYLKAKKSNAEAKESHNEEIKKINNIYKKVVNTTQ